MSLPTPQSESENENPFEDSEVFEKVDRTMKNMIGLGVYRVVILLGVIAQLWLTVNYVKRAEFDKLQTTERLEFERIQSSITEIQITMKLMAQQDKKLDDYESRLRVLEKRY